MAKLTAQEYLKRPYARIVVPEADGSFRGEILEFPGCLALAETAAKALEQLEEVAESWIETTLARGQMIPPALEENDYSGKLVLRLPRSVHQKAARLAEIEGVSLNQFIAAGVAIQVGERSAYVRAPLIVQQVITIQTDQKGTGTQPSTINFSPLPNMGRMARA